MTFQELNLNTALYSALDDLGYTIPTTIQHKVFPIAMSGKDVCGIAQTGTGKTMAYLLPCLKQWKFDKNKDPQILISSSYEGAGCSSGRNCKKNYLLT
jgi:ATP-dependent RNA helicase RhlE